NHASCESMHGGSAVNAFPTRRSSDLEVENFEIEDFAGIGIYAASDEIMMLDFDAAGGGGGGHCSTDCSSTSCSSCTSTCSCCSTSCSSTCSSSCSTSSTCSCSCSI